MGITVLPFSFFQQGKSVSGAYKCSRSCNARSGINGRIMRSHCTVRRFSPAFNNINDLMRAI